MPSSFIQSQNSSRALKSKTAQRKLSSRKHRTKHTSTTVTSYSTGLAYRQYQ